MILYGWKIGLNYRESNPRLVAAGRDQAPSYRTVLNWFHEYACRTLDVSNSPRYGRPRTVLTDEKINVVRLMINDDLHLTYQQIEFYLRINSSTIYLILHSHLKLGKICARWVSHSLTNDFNFNSVANHRNSSVFDIITDDESSFHHYDPESKQQSKT